MLCHILPVDMSFMGRMGIRYKKFSLREPFLMDTMGGLCVYCSHAENTIYAHCPGRLGF